MNHGNGMPGISDTELIRVYEDENLAKIYGKYRLPYCSSVPKEIMQFMREKSPANNQDGRYARMLDVGCGCGTLSTQMFSKYFQSILGVDISEAKIRQAKLLNKSENITFEVIHSHKFPVEDNSIDLITSGTSIHFLDIKEFEKECQRVLKPGGICAAFALNSRRARSINIHENDSSCISLEPMIDQFFVDIEAHPSNFESLDGNRPIFDRIQNPSKRWLKEIVSEKELSLQKIKDTFQTTGEYVMMKKRKLTVDPLEILAQNIEKGLQLDQALVDEDIMLSVELVMSTFVFIKDYLN
ncbi:putative methyltransferase DDB_G0268948 [Styela clava]